MGICSEKQQPDRVDQAPILDELMRNQSEVQSDNEAYDEEEYQGQQRPINKRAGKALDLLKVESSIRRQVAFNDVNQFGVEVYTDPDNKFKMGVNKKQNVRSLKVAIKMQAKLTDKV